MNEGRGKRDRREENEQARRELLEAGSLEAGKRWASGWREDLRKEGRATAGGWPGTVAEARAHVLAYFTAELSRRKMASLTHEELDRAAKAAYAAAKRDWLSRCEPDTSGS